MSWDFAINIYKNNKYLFTIAGHNAFDDYIIYSEIKKIINIKDIANLNKEELINIIESNSEYMRLLNVTEPIKNESNIDIANKTVNVKDGKILFDVNKGKYQDDDYELIIHEKKAWDLFELDSKEIILLYYIELDEDLVNKETLSFDEFNKLSDSYLPLIENDNGFGYNLNGKYYLRFNTLG